MQQYYLRREALFEEQQLEFRNIVENREQKISAMTGRFEEPFWQCKQNKHRWNSSLHPWRRAAPVWRRGSITWTNSNENVQWNKSQLNVEWLPINGHNHFNAGPNKTSHICSLTSFCGNLRDSHYSVPTGRFNLWWCHVIYGQVGDFIRYQPRCSLPPLVGWSARWYCSNTSIHRFKMCKDVTQTWFEPALSK